MACCLIAKSLLPKPYCQWDPQIHISSHSINCASKKSWKKTRKQTGTCFVDLLCNGNVWSLQEKPSWAMSLPRGLQNNEVHLYINCLIFSKMLTTDTASPVRVSYGWFVREFKVSLGLYSQLQRHRLTGIIIPIINPRQSDDRLRFIIGIPIPIRWCLLGEYRPWSVLLSPLLCCMQHHVILDVS